MKMNKNTKVVAIRFILSLFLGMTVVVLLNSPIQGSGNSLISREIVSQINAEKSMLLKNEKKINGLSKEYRKLQKNSVDEKSLLSESEENNIIQLRLILGLEEISGEGIIVKIESIESDQNIAFAFDADRVLLRIINVAKAKGAETIAINNQIISVYSGVVLAGNHININNVPLTSPYEIKIIGNDKTLYRYFDQESVFFKTITKKYNVTVDISRSREITIPKNHLLKELEFIKELG